MTGPHARQARARIKAAAAVNNNDSPDVLARVAIRDGEAWNDRRLPEVGRALQQALMEIDALAADARRALHEWSENATDENAQAFMITHAAPLIDALQACIPWVAASKRGMAQEALALPGRETGTE